MDGEFYLQARREWDERYGDLVLRKRNWQIASAGLMLRTYKRMNGAGDRGRTGDVQLGNSPNQFSRKPRYHRLFGA